jgi:hypothetical protein
MNHNSVFFCMHSHFAGEVEFMAIFETFKTCPKCSTRWKTRGDFLSDGAIESGNPGETGLSSYLHDCVTPI